MSTGANKTSQRGASRVAQPARSSLTLMSMFFALVKILGVAGLVFFGAVLVYRATPYLDPEILQVRVEGELNRLNAESLAAVVSSRLSTGLLTLDLDEVRDPVAAIAWVESVELIKDFPSTLVLSVVEEQAVARWNDRGYISTKGEFIESDVYEDLSDLPVIFGAADPSSELAARQALNTFHLLNSVALTDKQRIRELHQSRTGGWTMIWESGLSIDLGRVDHLNRVRHLMLAWEQFPHELRQRIEHIDTRYGNGVAIRTRPSVPGQQELIPGPETEYPILKQGVNHGRQASGKTAREQG